MDTPVESAKRGREDDGVSVTVAGPEEGEWRESASKIQRKDAVKEDDDMNIQGMEINVDEGDENVEEDELSKSQRRSWRSTVRRCRWPGARRLRLWRV